MERCVRRREATKEENFKGITESAGDDADLQASALAQWQKERDTLDDEIADTKSYIEAMEQALDHLTFGAWRNDLTDGDEQPITAPKTESYMYEALVQAESVIERGKKRLSRS
ncbi:unnamed protein product [Vitrella brassicaformis CCMP3155]|uniref:Uncharacterized protein n=1 Tax=Vitrella brassicaformis (strain CCMP3155) TaxID=1169540 RepID=A0A0G4EZH1_VITBC|nr:unnamed protein product [Vitrella brassicaformis CCMP3155]|eukprot:CEM04498.1 unnamed protein product [Vitrella brassicaformis CCMP3155]